MEKEELQIDKLEQSLTFGEQFNFNQIWRVKGTEGLFNIITRPNPSGMVRVGGFLNPAIAKTVKKDNLICLGWYDFITTEPAKGGEGFKVLKLTQVFDNIFNYVDSSDDFKLEKLTMPAFMEMAVPKYDESQFKNYHAELVKKWYLLCIELLKAVTVNEEGEAIEPINNGE